jgi:hypothetical protein
VNHAGGMRSAGQLTLRIFRTLHVRDMGGFNRRLVYPEVGVV